MANIEMPIPLSIPGAGRQDRLDKRAQLFRETLPETAMRWIMGTAYGCHPKRIADLPSPAVVDACRPRPRRQSVPDGSATHPRPDTFAGVARAVSPDTVLAAARLGFFPWCHFGPLKWWTRQNRMVLFLGEQRVAKRLPAAT